MFAVTVTAAPGTPGGTCAVQPLYLCGLVSVNECGQFPAVCLSESLERVLAKLHACHLKSTLYFRYRPRAEVISMHMEIYILPISY